MGFVRETKPKATQTVYLTGDDGSFVAAEVFAVFPNSDNPANWVLGWRANDNGHLKFAAAKPVKDWQSVGAGDGSVWKVGNVREQIVKIEHFAFVLYSAAAPYLYKKESDMDKLTLATHKEEFTDAAWRQGIEKGVGLAHKRIIKLVTEVVGPVNSKVVAALLATDPGRHAMSWSIGALMTMVPTKDKNLTRAAKELRIYGWEYVTGRIADLAAGIAADFSKCLPKDESASHEIET